MNMRTLLFLALTLLSVACLPNLCWSYSNVTLSSGELQVTVYLPAGSKDNGDDIFYQSSRFEHGSMIGSIQRKSSITGKTTELYGPELWRIPHNPYWPESGVGLASEFGAGDDGANCDYKCGWNGVDDVTNGLLGYKEALNGEGFLKIGVGELIKGSCLECDFTGDYKFNSPYQFKMMPQWNIIQPAPHILVLQHEARLNQFGYRLQKDVILDANVLTVTSTLTNLGSESFRTAWYSHHFFNCNAIPIGPSYSVSLDLHESKPQLYEEPGLSGWTVPLRGFAKVRQLDNSIKVEMKRSVDSNRIKAEFLKDPHSTGSFTIQACGLSIQEDIPEVQTDASAPISMYAFNLYVEDTTISPEPQLLIHLAAGASTRWTQRIEFLPQQHNPTVPQEEFNLNSIGVSMVPPSQEVETTNHLGGIAFVFAAMCLSTAMIAMRWNGRRIAYTQIQDCSLGAIDHGDS